MNCISCGQKISHKAIEGADYIRVNSDHWCKSCAVDKLAKWRDFERIEKLAEEPGRCREALLKSVKIVVSDNNCCGSEWDQRHCEASPDECFGCWLKYLVEESEE